MSEVLVRQAEMNHRLELWRRGGCIWRMMPVLSDCVSLSGKFWRRSRVRDFTHRYGLCGGSGA